MESNVFTEEVHNYRSFMEIFGFFFILVVLFLYFVPDYFGISYIKNIGLNWNIVFIVTSISVPVVVGIFGIHLFTLPEDFDKNHPYITSILTAVNLFLLTVIVLVMCMLFVGITYFLLEIIYIIISSLLLHSSY